MTADNPWAAVRRDAREKQLNRTDSALRLYRAPRGTTRTTGEQCDSEPKRPLITRAQELINAGRWNLGLSFYSVFALLPSHKPATAQYEQLLG